MTGAIFITLRHEVGNVLLSNDEFEEFVKGCLHFLRGNGVVVALVEEFKALDCLLLCTTVLVPLLCDHILSEGEVDTGAAVEIGVGAGQVLVLVLLV